jgi:hypothetical protein
MYSKLLRKQLTTLAKQYAEEPGRNYTYNSGLTEIPKSAIILDKTGDNFTYEAWETIKNNPNYFSRTQKAHSSFDQTNPKDEMQSSNSSDALLMNIFCDRFMKTSKGILKLLNVGDLSKLTFGYSPGVALMKNGVDKTEIDLFIQDGDKKIFCESKLTETDFVFKPLSEFQRYKDFEAIFDSTKLPVYGEFVANYQLVRNILAAYQFNASFYLFIDARRPDLAKSFYQTLRCVKDIDLRMRCEIFYWQDLAAVAHRDLQEFLKEKYGINQ